MLCLSDNREEWCSASVWIMTGGLGGPWVPDMTCALCPRITLSSLAHLSAVAALLRPTVTEAVVCRVGQRLVQDLCKVWPPFGSILQGLLWGERSPLAFMRPRFTVASAQIMAPHYWLAESVWKNCFDCILSYGAVCLNVMRSSLGFLIG